MNSAKIHYLHKLPKYSPSKETNSNIKMSFIRNRQERLVQFTRVLDYLYLTSLDGVTLENIRRYNISFLVNATMEDEDFHFPGVENLQVPLVDTTDADILSVELLDEVCDKIEKVSKKGRNVLIHSFSGTNRAPTLLIAYLMKYRGMHLKDAFVHVNERRPGIQLNPEFWQQLIAFEQKLFNYTTVQMLPTTDALGKPTMAPDIRSQ